MPRVSVVIPAYNHVDYIGECVDSVLSQTFRDFEVIVVDDGSTDGTEDILRSYGDRIRYCRQMNAGTQVARNRAVGMAQGDWIALIDSDDVWLSTRLERQIEEIDHQPQVGLVYSEALVIDGDGRVGDPPLRIGRGTPTGMTAFESILLENPVPCLTALVRRELLDPDMPFDTSYVGASDLVLWLAIAAEHAVAFVPEPLALYRVHSSNTTKALQASLGIYEERTRAIRRAIELHPDLAPPQVRAKAEANASMELVECHMLASDLDSASAELARAAQVDASILGPVLRTRLLGLLQPLLVQESALAIYRSVRTLVRRLPIGRRGRKRLQRALVAELALAEGYSRHQRGENRGQMGLALLGLANSPRELANWGLWRRTASALVDRPEDKPEP